MIYISADDYGLSEFSDLRIAECVKYGSLNKISAFVNSDRDAEMHFFEDDDIYLSLHLNLVEGRSVSCFSEIPLLADEDGRFIHSFGGLLKLHFSSKRKEFEKQLVTEIRNQIRKWIAVLPENKPVMIDSHQHVHMIPSVFSSLLKALEEEGIKADYIRIPAEPLMPYIMTPSLYLSYSPVNLIKQWLLKLLFWKSRKKFKKCGAKTAYFMGILFSGRMDFDRVDKILEKYKTIASKNDADIEILFHPGYTNTDENLPDAVRGDFKKFYLSDNRRLEYDSILKIKK